MHTISQLEKQQVGLRLPKYLVEEIDSFTAQFSINRTDVIVEAITSYISEQKANIFYSDFDAGCKELKKSLDNNSADSLKSLDELIDELDHKNS
ncbi:MAG: ribbon-helix-helix domain-containing protein [Campylobacterota bacterium]|nr:ribbon-helix-helix domain-containing protein [Campylobacterota bacterium]